MQEGARVACLLFAGQRVGLVGPLFFIGLGIILGIMIGPTVGTYDLWRVYHPGIIPYLQNNIYMSNNDTNKVYLVPGTNHS